MPLKKTVQEMPEPLDNRVQLFTLPAQEIAVIRFKGYARRDEVGAMKARLPDSLKKCRDRNQRPAVVVTPQPSGCATTGTMRHGHPGSCGEMRSRFNKISRSGTAPAPTPGSPKAVMQPAHRSFSAVRSWTGHPLPHPQRLHRHAPCVCQAERICRQYMQQ